jgi:hypothetical protein
MTTTLVPPPRPTGDLPPHRRPGFVVVTAIGLLIALATITWATFAAFTVFTREEASSSASYRGVQSVTVDAGDGNVAITPVSGDTTRLDQKLQWSFQRPTVNVAQSGSHLTIRVRCPFQLVWSCSIHLSIQLPPATALNIHTGSGNISVTGVTAGASLSTSDGNVKATRVSGNLSMHSSDGNVTATDTRADSVEASSGDGTVRVDLASSPTEVRATSSDGNVSVLVPDQPGVTYQVSAHTSNGSQDVTVRTDPSSPRHITARSSDGDVEVKYR